MSLTAYPTLRLKLTMPQALKLQFLPAIPGSNAAASAAAAEAAAAQAEAAAAAAASATTNKVDRTGDTMTGFLTLSAAPTALLHAATKQYVDAHAGGGSLAASQLAGRGAASGSGTAEAITLGTNLTMSGTTLNATGGSGGGNVSNSGTPAANDVAQWVTSTSIKGVALNTWRTTPNFFNILDVKSAVGGDGVALRGLANQGWVYATGATADVSLALSSQGNGVVTFYNGNFGRVCGQFTSSPSGNTFPTFTGGVGNSTLANNPPGNPIVMGSDLQLTTGSTAVTQTAGDSSTKVATTAFVGTAVAAGGTGGGSGPPQGRLTLQTATPVMTTTQSAKTTIFYTPYVGNKVPIYDGTNMVMTTFAELSNVTTASSTGSAGPAAVTANSNYDLFVWNNAGTVTLTRGPLWTSSAARGTGVGTTELVMVSGVLLNAVAITNGPAASRGTYVGTTRSNASSQLDWILGSLAANGGAAFHNVWNCYNRVTVVGIVSDTSDSWTGPAAGVIRQANSSSTMAVSFVMGLAEDYCSADYSVSAGSGAGYFSCGIGLDSTSAFSGRTGYCSNASTNAFPMFGSYSTQLLGFHVFRALECAGGAGPVTWYGDAGVAANIQNGLSFLLRM